MSKISIVLATYNEENNITDCLKSVKGLADEIVVVDGTSSDKTVEIAKSFGAKIHIYDNPKIFHINKQKAIDLATGDWILQLDADERVSRELVLEIKKVIGMSEKELKVYEDYLPGKKIFLRHQDLINHRDGVIGRETGSFDAFYIPRLNYFLGKFIKYGGVYPDGVIRLIKKGKAYLPCQNVHEQMVVEGRVGWLQHDLIHMADPTFQRYLIKNSCYVDLIADELRKNHVSKDLIQAILYFLIKPLSWFILTQIRYKGILDGYQGIVFSFFSALRFPRAYYRYLTK